MISGSGFVIAHEIWKKKYMYTWCIKTNCNKNIRIHVRIGQFFFSYLNCCQLPRSESSDKMKTSMKVNFNDSTDCMNNILIILLLVPNFSSNLRHLVAANEKPLPQNIGNKLCKTDIFSREAHAFPKLNYCSATAYYWCLYSVSYGFLCVFDLWYMCLNFQK